MVAPFLPDEEKVAAIRAELVASGAGSYFDAAAAGPLPAEADRAMREWADWELRTGRAGPVAEVEFGARVEEARAAAAAVLGAPVSRVALAPGVAFAIRLAVEARRWRTGERIVAGDALELPVMATLESLALAVGAEIAMVEVGHGTTGRGSPDQGLLGRLDRAMSVKTALVVVPHVSPLDGSLVPVAEVAARARRHGAWLAVDGSLAAGAIAVDAPALGAEIYASAGDRWLLGPSGTAAVYISPIVGDAVAAALPADQLNRAAVVGLGRSIGWLAMQVGLEWAFDRTRRLLRLAGRLLESVEGVSLLAPTDRVVSLFCFRVAGWPAARLREVLGRRAFAIVGLVEPVDAVRVSIGCWNTEDEIRRFADAVAELAATTPDRLPDRPPILIVPGERS